MMLADHFGVLTSINSYSMAKESRHVVRQLGSSYETRVSNTPLYIRGLISARFGRLQTLQCGTQLARLVIALGRLDSENICSGSSFSNVSNCRPKVRLVYGFVVVRKQTTRDAADRSKYFISDIPCQSLAVMNCFIR